MVCWNVAIALRMNRQIKAEANVKSNDELLAKQMKKCSIPGPDSAGSMDAQLEREMELLKELKKPANARNNSAKIFFTAGKAR